MTVDEIKAHYGFIHDIQVARQFGVTKSAVRRWRVNGIPAGRQALIQIASNYEIKADKNLIAAVTKTTGNKKPR